MEQETETVVPFMLSIPKGIFESLLNGTWPSEEDFETAERQAAQRVAEYGRRP